MSGILWLAITIGPRTRTVPPTFTAGQICKLYGILPWQLKQALVRGFLSEPPRVGPYRVWFEADLPRVREALIRAGYLHGEVTCA